MVVIAGLHVTIVTAVTHGAYTSTTLKEVIVFELGHFLIHSTEIFRRCAGGYLTEDSWVIRSMKRRWRVRPFSSRALGDDGKVSGSKPSRQGTGA